MPHRAMFVILALLSIMNVFAFAGGDGSEGNPYHVSTVNELQDCRNHPTLHFIQICDIDASSTSGWAGGNGFRPIGESNAFNGSYDGQGYTIDGLHINRPNDNRIGLFGEARYCDIRNVRLTNLHVTGSSMVGGLAGLANDYAHISGCFVDGDVSGLNRVGLIAGRISYYGLIEECSSHGSVTAPEGEGYCAGIVGFSIGRASILRCCNSATINGEKETGGIVGRTQSGTTVKNCYNTGAVIGTDMVGGVCGYCYGTDLIDCFSTGSVTGNSSTGGLVGMTDNSSVEDCFWNVQTSGQSIGDSGTGLTTAEMKELSTYFSAGWDFVSETANGTNNCWDMDLEYDFHGGYPYLAWEDGAGVCLTLPQGNGTQSAPFQIETLNHLKYISILPSTWSKNFIQTSDIDASSSQYLNDGAGFNPIGNDSTAFTGIYDGQGYTIDGLYINRPDTDCVGLFGKVRNCELQNIRFENCSITGARCVGALAGEGDSYINVSGCYVDGTVSGSECVGSVVGNIGEHSLIQNCSSNGSATSSGSKVAGITAYLGQFSSIKRCCNTAQVYGSSRCGGIAALCSGNSSIQCCYNTGAIIGGSLKGGIVGKTSGTSFVQCYSTGYVSSGTNSGGLSGESSGSSYDACFWNVESSYQSNSDGGIGLTRAEMNTLSTYTDAGWDFVSETANGTNDYWDMDVYGELYYRYPVLAWEDGDAQYLYIPSGSGTESEPYQIETIEHLAWLSASTSDWDAYFIQTCDIDAAPASSWHDDKGLSPIGNVETAFSGHYDGQGFTIDGLNINRPDDHAVALFGGMTDGGSIENLHMTNVDITGHSTVGGLAGHIQYDSRVTGCSVTGNVAAQSYSGLLIASVYFGSTVTDSWAQGVLNVAGDYAGGIACSMSDSSSVVRCYTDVTVSGSDYVGGLIGRAKTSDVIDCYSMGSATGENGVGGSIGYIFGGTLTNSFSTVAVTGETNVGGLTGMYADDAEVTGCFWDTETSGQSESHGGEGKTTAEMKSLYMYHSYGWDFVSEHSNGTADTWDIDQDGSCNDGYPVLSWETGEQYFTGPSGSGTGSSPYLIEQLTDLWWISVHSDEWSKVYLQTADIDASDTETWYDGCGFSPIGSDSTSFTGSYNGQGYTIDGLFINRPDTDNVGFFGLGCDCEISNVQLMNINITGQNCVGGLAGQWSENVIATGCKINGYIYSESCAGLVVGSMGNDITVQDCCTSEYVSSNVYHVGGITGLIEGSATIERCCNSATVHGWNRMGGIAGWISGHAYIGNCYSTGSISGYGGTFGGLIGFCGNSEVVHCYSTGNVSEHSNSGGLIGVSYISSVEDCFWDVDTSGYDTSSGGTGLTTAEMKTLSTYIDAGWDFVAESDNGSDDYWDMDIYNEYSDGYPYLSWQDGDEQSMCVVQGNGTTEDPYLIGLPAELQWMSRSPSEWDKCFRQIADIDASDTENWDNGNGFSPVGNTSTAFSGEYDGQGYSIDGLFIHRDSTNENGLFGQVTGGTISNLNVLNCNITGKYRTSAIAASCNDATIVNCTSSGTVSTSNGGGGIVGRMRETTVERCGSSVDISSYASTGKNCGGLVGITSQDCVIRNSYAHGSVEAYNFCGGLIGDMEDTDVQYCYSTGTVTTTSTPVGGLIGEIREIWFVESCFWDTGTSGQSTSSAGIGKTTAEMQTLSTYTDAGWDFCGESDNGTDDIWFIATDNYPEFNDFTAPVITAIEDIAHDQGHQVMVCWDEAKTDTHDDPESCYKLYRMVSDQWELLATIPDDNAEYTYNAATLVDSSATLELDDFLTTFKVVYEWSTGSIESATATGYSVDNISPYATSGVTLTFSGSRDESVSLTRKSSVKLPSAAMRTTSAILSWNQVTEGGFGGNSYPEQNGVWYRVYAGDTPDFPCDGSTLLGTTQDTSYEITPMDSVQKFFKVVVSDQP